MPPVLETQRLLLRELRPDDAAAVFDVFDGDCGLSLQDVEGVSELEVGWHVRADQRRRGLATEAGRACLDWGMRRTDYPRIVSLVHVENPASSAVAQRVHEGRLREPVERRRGPHWVYVSNRRPTP